VTRLLKGTVVMASTHESAPGTASGSRPRQGSHGPHVLIVSGGDPLAALWRPALLRKHFVVTSATTCRTARQLLLQHAPDILVLDMTEAAAEALLLCRRLRAEGSTLPVLMLHPRGTLEDLLTGFEAGADAYLRGWFDPAELLCQIGALCRRHAGGAASAGVQAGAQVSSVPH
jgi:two-component system phosphate regulon response regulator OmpR